MRLTLKIINNIVRKHIADSSHLGDSINLIMNPQNANALYLDPNLCVPKR